MPEISEPRAPDADLRQVGQLWADLSQVDGIALPPPKKYRNDGWSPYAFPKEHATSTEERENCRPEDRSAYSGSNGNETTGKRTCFEIRPGTPYDTRPIRRRIACQAACSS